MHQFIVTAHELPQYASGNLWFKNQDGDTSRLDQTGKLSVAIAGDVTLHWAHPDGSILGKWNNLDADVDKVEWNGIMRLGGFVERTHIVEYGGLGIMVIELTGGAYSASYDPLPSLERLKEGAYTPDDMPEEDPSQDDNWYSLLLPIDSPFADFAHHALVNGSAIDCTAIFGDDAGQWQHLVGLPLVLNSITLLSSTY